MRRTASSTAIRLIPKGSLYGCYVRGDDPMAASNPPTP